MSREERIQWAVADEQLKAATEEWYGGPQGARTPGRGSGVDDTPERAALAARITHWKRVLQAIGA